MMASLMNHHFSSSILLFFITICTIVISNSSAVEVELTPKSSIIKKEISPFDNEENIRAPSNEVKHISDSFKISTNTIIRTKESRALGAKYLNESRVESREECLRWCWNYRSTDHSTTCNLAVFEEQEHGTCYLFECGSQDNFKCRFTSHDSYTSALLNVNRQTTELSEWKDQNDHENELRSLIDLKPDPSKKVQQSKSSTTEKKIDKHSCQHFQFACKNSSDCIAIYNVCDGIPQCSDSSDESPDLHCPSSQNEMIIQPESGMRNPSSGSRMSSSSKGKPPQLKDSPNYYSTSDPIFVQPQIGGINLVPPSAPIMDFHYPKSPEVMRDREPGNPISYMGRYNNYFSKMSPNNGNGKDGIQTSYGSPIAPDGPMNGRIFNNYPYYPQVEYYNPMDGKNPPNGGSYSPDSPDYGNRDGPPPPLFWSVMSDPQSREKGIRDGIIAPGTYAIQPSRERGDRGDGEGMNSDIRPKFWTSNGNPRVLIVPPSPLNGGVIFHPPQMQHKLKGSSLTPTSVPSPNPFSSVLRSPPLSTMRPNPFSRHENPNKMKPIHNIPINMVSHIRPPSYATHEVAMAVSHLRDSDPSGRDTNSAVIALTLGLSITAMLVGLVGCRMKSIRKRIARRGGRSLAHDADYLVNGMYL